MNNENLKKGKATQFKSGEEAVSKARKGGIRSGEVKRERKLLKETILMMLAEGNTQDNIVAALLEKAMSGDTKAFEVIRDSIGEKQKEQVDMNTNITMTDEDRKLYQKAVDLL